MRENKSSRMTLRDKGCKVSVLYYKARCYVIWNNFCFYIDTGYAFSG